MIKIKLTLAIISLALIPLFSQDYLSRVQVSGEEVELELNRLIIQNSLQNGEFSEPEKEELRENIREGIIMRKLLLSLAAYREITVTDEEADALVMQARGDYPEEDWNELLESQLYTPESFRKVLRESQLIDRVLDREVLSGITVSDEEIEAYYEAHEADYTSDFGLIPLTEVKDLIREILTARKKQEETARFMNDLYSKAMFVE